MTVSARVAAGYFFVAAATMQIAIVACGSSSSDAAGEKSDASESGAADGSSSADATSVEASDDGADGALQVVLSMTPVASIDPHLYGSNYDWNCIPATKLTAFDTFMRGTADYQLARYPGGFNAEHYNWSTNTEDDWDKWDGGPPGAAPAQLLDQVPEANFITPSHTFLENPTVDSGLVQLSSGLVNQYSSKVHIWEIGNEWFNQYDKNSANAATLRATTLSNYAALVAAVAPALKAADPSIEIYATGEWTVLTDFSTLRTLVGETAWASVDGISIHPYCGTDATTPPTLCSDIPSQVAAIKAASGKTKVFASEWAVTRDDTAGSGDNVAVRNASQLVLAIQSLAIAGVNAATYWPPCASEVPQLAFASDDYSTARFDGVAFGWMSNVYRGQALSTTGSLPAAAALGADGSVSIIIPSMANGAATIEIPLAGTSLTSVTSAEVLYDAILGDAEVADDTPLTATLPTEIVPTRNGGTAVRFVVNPGTVGRGAGWEIARLTLH